MFSNFFFFFFYLADEAHAFHNETDIDFKCAAYFPNSKQKLLRIRCSMNSLPSNNFQ